MFYAGDSAYSGRLGALALIHAVTVLLQQIELGLDLSGRYTLYRLYLISGVLSKSQSLKSSFLGCIFKRVELDKELIWYVVRVSMFEETL